MTSEQKKVLSRCRSMIKRAFPSMTGKLIFRLDSSRFGDKSVPVDMFMPALKLDEFDVDNKSEANVVNIQ